MLVKFYFTTPATKLEWLISILVILMIIDTMRKNISASILHVAIDPVVAAWWRLALSDTKPFENIFVSLANQIIWSSLPPRLLPEYVALKPLP